MSARRALITGVAGQDGSYLAELLLERGYEVFGIVRGSPHAPYPNLAGVQNDVRLLQGDLLDQMTLLDAITRAEPDELYNLAATSFVPASWRQPVMTAQFTAVGVTSMLEAVRITKPTLRVYQASTSEIFGATTESPQTESTRQCSNPSVATRFGTGGSSIWLLAALCRRWNAPAPPAGRGMAGSSASPHPVNR